MRSGYTVLCHIWNPDRSSWLNSITDFGHSAIEVLTKEQLEHYSAEDDSGYFDFAPATQNIESIIKQTGVFRSKQEYITARRRADEIAVITGLNGEAMLAYGNRLKAEHQRSVLEDDPTKKTSWFGIIGLICSTLVMNMLKVGEMEKIAPCFARFGTWKHYQLLLLRPEFVLACMSPLIIRKLVPPGNDSVPADVAAFFMLIISMAITGYINKYGYWSLFESMLYRFSKGRFGAISNLFAHQSRSLVEICYLDSFVQNITYAVLVISGIIKDNIAIYDLVKGKNGALEALGSFGIWLALMTVSVTLGFVLSKVIYAITGLSAIVRPSGIKAWIHHVERIKDVPEVLRAHQFKLEEALFALIIPAAVVSFICHHYYNDLEYPLVFGTIISLTSGAVVSRFAVTYINFSAKNEIMAGVDINSDQQLTSLLSSHDPEPEWIALVCMGSILGMIGAVDLADALVDINFVRFLAVVAGALLGNALGTSIYWLGSKIKTELYKNHMLFAEGTQQAGGDVYYKYELQQRDLESGISHPVRRQCWR